MTTTQNSTISGPSGAGVPVYGPSLDFVRAWVGGVFCVVFAAWQEPQPLNVAWGQALLLLAPLALIPLTIVILQKSAPPAAAYAWELVERFELSAATVLIGSFIMPPAPTVALLTIPWLLVTLTIGWCGVLGLARRQYRDISTTTIDIGCIFLAVGGVWTTIERCGFSLWGFDAVIALLTAVHFHYAGFLLLLATGWAARELAGSRVAKWSCIGVLAGVPLTALGITLAHFKVSAALEAFTACFMAAAGVLVAWTHLVVAQRSGAPQPVRLLWTLSSAALTAGMALATLYALRNFVKLPILDIPHMRAIHGTLNALGFGLCGITAWRLHRRGLVRT